MVSKRERERKEFRRERERREREQFERERERVVDEEDHKKWKVSASHLLDLNTPWREILITNSWLESRN